MNFADRYKMHFMILVSFIGLGFFIVALDIHETSGAIKLGAGTLGAIALAAYYWMKRAR